MRSVLLLLTIAASHLLVRLRQTIVSTLGVVMGVGFFLAVSGMMVGSQQDFVRTLVNNAPHIIVRDEERDPGAQPASTRYPDGAVSISGVRPGEEVRGLRDWPAMLQDVRSTPGALAAPALSGAVTLRFAGRTEGLGLLGVDPRIEGRLTDISDTLVGGSLLDLEARPQGIIISRALANRLSAHLGDSLIVSASSGQAPQTMPIIALIDPEAGAGFYGGDATGYALLRTAQVVFGRPNIVNQLHIKLADPQVAQAYAQAWEGRWGYSWQSWQERSRDILNLLVVRNVIMFAVIGAILVVASFGIYTAVSNSVVDKRRDIAILRAIGFSKADLQAVFVIEGLVIGLIGAALGCLLGSLLWEALAHAPLSVGGKPLTLPLDRSPRQYLISIATSLSAGLIAAWLPARKAASVDPVDILRGAA